MTVKENLTQTKELMQKALEHCKSQISKVRTGRASATLLEGVKVDYYGTPTPISQVAGISTPDARTIVVQPFDRSILTAIDKSIQSAGLGFNPQNDGTILRIPVPPLTEERRKEFVKMCKKHAEDGKIVVRNIRRDQIEDLKKAEKNKEFAEDDRKKGEEEIQKLTDTFIKNIDTESAAKEKELMDN
jgi:ribosome recycling factor